MSAPASLLRTILQKLGAGSGGGPTHIPAGSNSHADHRQDREARRVRSQAPVPTPMPPEDMKVEDVRFFIGGHGRSGTTWLERTLNTHPEVLCLGPGMWFGRSLRNLGGRRVLYEVLSDSEGLKTWHGFDENLWTKPEEFDGDVAQIVRASIDALMRRRLTESGKRVLGDRTPHHISHQEEIHALYPAAKIIHAIRDGRDTAISNVHAFWKSAEDRGGHIKLSLEERGIRDAYYEDREALLASGGSIFTEERIRQQASGWNRIVRQGGETGRGLFGENYFEFFYEKHLHRPHEALGELFGFLQVDTSPEVIEKMVEENTFEKLSKGRSSGEESSGAFFRKGISGDWKGVFNERDKRVFKEEAGDLLVELGYEKDLDW